MLPACTTRQLSTSSPSPARNVGGQSGAEAQAHNHEGSPGSYAGPNEEATHSEQNVDELPGVLSPPALVRKPHPLARVSKAALEKMVLDDSEEIGCASLGKTNAGALYGAVKMASSDHWHVNNGRESYGTTETIRYLSHAINRVNELYPDSPKISIGDISTAKGGHFKPHQSHQSGRDVDLGFYYKDGSRWYSHANKENLDLERTWALVKFTVTETDVEFIFLDRTLQKLLREHATDMGVTRRGWRKYSAARAPTCAP